MMSRQLKDILDRVNAEFPQVEGKVAFQGLLVDIAIAVGKMRRRRGLSQRDLAKRLKTGQSTVARWETPGYSAYTLTKLNDLANSLNYELQLAFVDRFTTPTKVITCGWQAKESSIPSGSISFSNSKAWNMVIDQSYLSNSKEIRV